VTQGAPIASIGTLEAVRVRVYVDEPELGRVKPGQAVRITWDALVGREWTGTVEKLPTEIIALGSRQVGEVLCTIHNPENQLLPGTNVNAFLLTETVTNAVTIPRTAVRRDNGTGVYVLGAGNTTEWREIKTGASDALNIQVLSGVQAGDAVAQPSDHALKAGEKITPVFPAGSTPAGK
jgi:HlyD family secretion protein